MSLSELEKKEAEKMVRQFMNQNKKTASDIERAIKANPQGLTVVMFKRRSDGSVMTSTYQARQTKDVMRMIWVTNEEADEGIRVYNQAQQLIHSFGACDYV